MRSANPANLQVKTPNHSMLKGSTDQDMKQKLEEGKKREFCTGVEMAPYLEMQSIYIWFLLELIYLKYEFKFILKM